MSQGVAIAMSGGVDSSLTAALLKEQGFDVVGVHMKLSKGEEWGGDRGCCALDSARLVAHQLNIPLEELDFSDEFREKVIQYFLTEYAGGRTPNPCVVCNWEIKFGGLLKWVGEHGFDRLATGHYARILKEVSYHLLSGIDNAKDQSYFLWTLNQEKLSRILFPLGELTKAEVRKMAEDRGLISAKRPDSQNICFVGDMGVGEFLRGHLLEIAEPGEVVDTEGSVIGAHQGLVFYTIGQRRGFKVTGGGRWGSSFVPPLYVIRKDVEKNQLVVGRSEDCLRDEFEVERVSWVNPEFTRQAGCLVRLRYQGELLGARLGNRGDGGRVGDKGLTIQLEGPALAITPGQSCVFYREAATDLEVLGGGVIK